MKYKRLLSWLLTFAMIAGMFVVPASAEGNTTTITQDNPSGTMTITLEITGTLSDSNVTLSADSFTYNGSTQKPTVTVKHQRGTGAEVTLTEDTDYTVSITDSSNNTVTEPTTVGTYTVTVTGKGVYSGTVSKTYSITASTPDAPAAPTKDSATKNSITLTAVDGCEYSMDGTSWQSSAEFTGLLPSTEYTFYQRVKATANTNASSASNAKFSTEADTYAMTITLVIKERAVTPAAPTVTQTTATSITVNTVSGCEYVLLPSGTELTNTHWEQSYQQTGSNSTHIFSELTPGTAYTVYARVRDTDELRASEPASTSTATLPAAPSASIGLSLIDYVNEQFKSSFVLDGITYEISPKSGTDFEGSKVSAGAKVNPDGDTTARTYYIRTAAITSPVAIPASETTAFIIPERPSRPDVKLFTAVNATGDATTDGKILGVNDKMAYATTESGAYTSITANATELTGLGKGSYYLRYQAVEGKAFSSKASDAVTIGSNAINLTAVSIVGNAKYGETLTATITPANSTGRITYAWYRGGKAISGATGSTYTLTAAAADIGSTITVKAAQDDKAPVESAATAIVTPADGSRTKPLLSESNIVKTQNKIQVVGFTNTSDVTYEYSKDGGVNWQDSATFDSLAENTPYRIAVREKEVKESNTVVKTAGVSSDVLPVRTEKDTQPLTGASLNGTAQVGSTLTAAPTPATATGLSYEWKYSGESTVLGTGSTYTLTSKDYGKVLTVTVKQGDSTSFSQSTSAVGQAPAVDLSSRTVNTTVSQHSITVTGFTNTPTRHYEYAITTSGDPTSWQNENEFTGLLAGTAYTVYVRTGSTKLDSQWQETGTYASASVSTNALKDPFNISNVQPAVVMSSYTYGATPPNPALTLKPETGAGAVTYWYSAAGFSATNGTNWNTTKPATAGTYYMRATVAANSDYAGYTTAAVQFTVEKAPAAAPTSVTASGTTVTVRGTGIASGSTVSYAVVTDSSTPAASAYKPVALKNYQFNLDGMAPSTPYTVYVCALGDANHTTSMPTSGSGTTPAQHSVAYNANGGSGKINTQTFTQGNSVTVKSVDGDTNDSGFIRPGYTFSRWTIAADGNGTAYGPNETNTTINTSATLYAQWTPNTYTIRFNPNGGTGSIDDLTATYGQDVLLKANTFTKTSGAVNYIFIGWATSANGPVSYADGQYVKNLTTESNATEGKGIVTLYAVWLEPPTTEITGHVTSAEGGTITLKLKRGDVQIGDTQIKALAETTDGYSCEYTFSRIPDGIYNVVAEQQVTRFKENGTDTYTEKLTKTAAVTIRGGAVVNDSGTQATTIEMPRSSASSVVNVTGTDTPPVVVGGLDTEAENNTVENRSVSMTISVEKQEKADETNNNADQETQAAISGIESVSASDTEQRDFLNIEVQKEVTKDGEVESSQTVTETQNPLELIIPYDMTGKQDYQIMFYRHHGGEAAKLNRHSGDGKPASSFGNGHFYIDLTNNLIYLWTNQFSTYAIGYDPEATESSNQGTTPSNPPSSYTPSGSGNTNTIAVPVSGDSASVSVSASVSGTTATVKAPTTTELNKVIGESVKTGDVTIDVSGLNRNIATVSIPAETVKAIEKAVSDPDNDASALTIKLTDGWVTFDAAALAAITDQAKGSTIQLNLDGVTESGLRTAQKTAIKDMDVQAIYDAYLTSNGQRISDFKGGKATVTVSYTMKDGQIGRGVVVWYVADDGKTTEVPTAYNDKTVSFTVEHFSNYVVAYDAERTAACPQDSTCPISAFTDASATAWYHDGVHYVLESGIMNGVGNGKFGPGNATSRAMIAQILWNMEGKPVVNYALSYTDVDANAWYAEAVRWATAQRIMNGYGGADGGKFGPNDDMTREQLVTIMYRYAQMKKVDVSIGEDTNILSYDDAFDVSEWAIPAMQWAVGAEIVNGTSASTLSPKNNASRAEIATIVMRYCEKNAK